MSLLFQDVVPGRCPQATPHSNCRISQLTPPIGVFLIILESGRHKLLVYHGLTLVTPSLCGWEPFSTPGTLTHTRITWALSPMASQVMTITLGSPLGPWCCGHSSWRGARHIVSQLYEILQVLYQGVNSSLETLMTCLGAYGIKPPKKSINNKKCSIITVGQEMNS